MEKDCFPLLSSRTIQWILSLLFCAPDPSLRLKALSHQRGIVQINQTLFGSAWTSDETSDGGLNGGPLVLLREVVSVRYEVISETVCFWSPVRTSHRKHTTYLTDPTCMAEESKWWSGLICACCLLWYDCLIAQRLLQYAWMTAFNTCRLPKRSSYVLPMNICWCAVQTGTNII